ncbi:3-oxoadipate enol-lactonase [Patulibacter minatonensis]|uniref:3-oxoadipate enol-lactonase n=1 Tax=Patulibacter minatonensis TaxID=298163 RepID=UPI00047D1624|nr:3-oxoadipate enol-lactonase [Patulibacter minatonensis]
MTVVLAHEKEGPADAPAVLLLHSIGTDREVWRPVAERLRAAGLRPVLVDLRGHGASPAPAPPYALADLADDVLALQDALGLGAPHVAGVSLGGMVAQWLGIHAPDRVDRLVLCCTAAHLGGPGMWDPRVEAVLRDGTSVLADGSIDRWVTPAFRAAHPGTEAALRRTVSTTPAAGYAGCASAIGAMDLRADLRRITAPTLVLAGADDPATTLEDHLRPLTDGIPGARLAVVPGASHLAPLERPDVVAEAMLHHLSA